MVCSVSSGVGISHGAVVSIGQQFERLNETFTYDLPTPSSVAKSNGPTTGGVAVTIYGHGIGENDYSARLRMGDSGCESSTWVSDSSVVCVVGSGVGGGGKTVTVSSGVQDGSMSEGWSYDVPVVSSVAKTNGASTGGFDVTVVGRGFGTSGYSVGVRVGGSGCERSDWVSDSSVVCGVSGGVGDGKGVVVSSGLQDLSHLQHLH
jgi:hypothetical protein